MWNIGGGIDAHISEIICKLNTLKPGIIKSTFDCYEILRWHGGRPFTKVPELTPDEFISKVRLLNKNNIGFYHVFSNNNIKENDLNDYWGNYILTKTESSLNGIVCNNLTMVNFIKKSYPLFKTIGSCTIENYTLEELLNLQNIFDILVLPPQLNRNLDLIKKLNIDKLEILVSERCLTDCKVRQLHYMLINKWNYTKDTNDFIKLMEFHNNPNSCFIRRNNGEKRHREMFLNKKEINYLKSIGIQNFKITERGDVNGTIINILNFIILNSDDSPLEKIKLLKNTIPSHYLKKCVISKRFYIKLLLP